MSEKTDHDCIHRYMWQIIVITCACLCAVGASDDQRLHTHTPHIQAAKSGDLWATAVIAAAAGGSDTNTCCVLALTTAIRWLK